MKKKIFLAGIVLASLSLTSATVALAVDGLAGPNGQQKKELGAMRADLQQGRQEIKDLRAENKEQNIEQKCAMIQNRIAERNTTLESNKEKHMSVYVNMKARIEKFVARLSSEGYDVSKLKADLLVLDGKILKIKTDLATQNAKMNETKDFACGHSDGDFKGKLTEARTMMQAIHLEAMEIRKFVQTTIRPDIQALRSQKVETKKDNSTVNTPVTSIEKPAVVSGEAVL